MFRSRTIFVEVYYRAIYVSLMKKFLYSIISLSIFDGFISKNVTRRRVELLNYLLVYIYKSSSLSQYWSMVLILDGNSEHAAHT